MAAMANCMLALTTKRPPRDTDPHRIFTSRAKARKAGETGAVRHDKIKGNLVTSFQRRRSVYERHEIHAAMRVLIAWRACCHGREFNDVNVLICDEDIRQGIKGLLRLADNPAALRQRRVRRRLYYIITEMTLSGELDTLFSQLGVSFDQEITKSRETTGKGH
jgi:hypothetical protein